MAEGREQEREQQPRRPSVRPCSGSGSCSIVSASAPRTHFLHGPTPRNTSLYKRNNPSLHSSVERTRRSRLRSARRFVFNAVFFCFFLSSSFFASPSSPSTLPLFSAPFVKGRSGALRQALERNID